MDVWVLWRDVFRRYVCFFMWACVCECVCERACVSERVWASLCVCLPGRPRSNSAIEYNRIEHITEVLNYKTNESFFCLYDGARFPYLSASRLVGSVTINKDWWELYCLRGTEKKEQYTLKSESWQRVHTPLSHSWSGTAVCWHKHTCTHTHTHTLCMDGCVWWRDANLRNVGIVMFREIGVSTTSLYKATHLASHTHT